jgi:hypothetical protein
MPTQSPVSLRPGGPFIRAEPTLGSRLMIVWKMLKIVGATVLGLMALYVVLMILIGSSRELVNGYYLLNLKSAYVISYEKHHEIIEPNVTQVGTWKSYVLGFREHTYSHMDSFVRPEGYFIIDTRDGSVLASLTRGEFIQELRRIGITSTSPEKLMRPVRIGF